MSDATDDTFLPTDDPVEPEEAIASLEDSIDNDDPTGVGALLADPSDAPDLLIDDDVPDPLGRSWAFDFINQRFAGGRAPLETYGDATLRGWIAKCLATPRGSYPIHPPDYGVQGILEIIGDPLGDLSGTLEGAIREALIFHPHISDVTDYSQDYDEDNEVLLLSFTVQTDEGDDIPVTNLPLGG